VGKCVRLSFSVCWAWRPARQDGVSDRAGL